MNRITNIKLIFENHSIFKSNRKLEMTDYGTWNVRPPVPATFRASSFHPLIAETCSKYQPNKKRAIVSQDMGFQNAYVHYAYVRYVLIDGKMKASGVGFPRKESCASHVRPCLNNILLLLWLVSPCYCRKYMKWFIFVIICKSCTGWWKALIAIIFQMYRATSYSIIFNVTTVVL